MFVSSLNLVPPPLFNPEVEGTQYQQRRCISISPDGLRDAERHESIPSFAVVNDTRKMANEYKLQTWLIPVWYLL